MACSNHSPWLGSNHFSVIVREKKIRSMWKGFGPLFWTDPNWSHVTVTVTLSRVGFGTLSVSVPVTSRRALCHTTLRMCICMSLYRIRVEMYTHVTWSSTFFRCCVCSNQFRWVWDLGRFRFHWCCAPPCIVVRAAVTAALCVMLLALSLDPGCVHSLCLFCVSGIRHMLAPQRPITYSYQGSI